MHAARKPHDCEPAPSDPCPLWAQTVFWMHAFESLEEFDEMEPVKGDLEQAEEFAYELSAEEANDELR